MRIATLAFTAASAFLGLTTYTAQAQNIPYGTTVNIYICGGECKTSPTRQAAKVRTIKPTADNKVTASANRQKRTPNTKVSGAVTCKINGIAAEYKVIWKSGGGGSCNGTISAKDLADVAKVARSGKMGWSGLAISFHIPKVCHDTGGYAVIRITSAGMNLYPNGWSKIGCNRRGYQSVAELNPRIAHLLN